MIEVLPTFLQWKSGFRYIEWMRTLFWLIFLLGAYLWVVTSDREAFLVERGRALYAYMERWFSEAEADFQWHAPAEPGPDSTPSKRRWD